MRGHTQDTEDGGESPKGMFSQRTTSTDSASSGVNCARRASRSTANGALNDSFKNSHHLQDAGSKTGPKKGGVGEQEKKLAGLKEAKDSGVVVAGAALGKSRPRLSVKSGGGSSVTSDDGGQVTAIVDFQIIGSNRYCIDGSRSRVGNSERSGREIAEIGAEDSRRETTDNHAGSGSAHVSPPQQQAANHSFLEVLLGVIWFVLPLYLLKWHIVRCPGGLLGV
jgi:hypothetical protein